MSLLSSTQGTPERVWSLAKLLEAHPQGLARDAVTGWLSPPFVQNRQVRPLPAELDGQALGAATSLKFIRREGGDYHLNVSLAADFRGFADQVHARLCAVGPEDPDFVVLEAFAWLVAEAEQRQSVAWAKASSAEFADAVEHVVGSDDPAEERRFNATKLAPWRRWLVLVGLGLELPGAIGFYPYVAERLLRELQASDLPPDEDLPIAEVIAVIARRMPYLDGGTLLSRVSTKMGFKAPPRRISRLLSVALRDLNDEGALDLKVRGDASDRFVLAPDGQHPIQSVQHVRLRKAAA